MSRTETIELASTPLEEPCAQVGTPEYGERARVECRAYRSQLLRMASAAGKLPENVRIIVKGSEHDYGTYYEAAVRFPEDDETACDAAYWIENNQPENWDVEARAELGLPGPEEEIPALGIFGEGS